VTAAGDDYGGLATVYDEWQERFGPFWQLCLPRLLAAVDQHGLPPVPPALVDLGCGTGGFLLGVQRERPQWRLAGVDASAGMLAHAARKPGAAAVRWVHARFDEPWLERSGLAPGTFAAAGSFFDAINHVTEAGALDRLCLFTAQALAPGGLFIFDVNNRQGYEAWWQGERVYRGPGWTLIMDARYDRRTGLAEGRATVRRGEAREVSEVSERCYPEEQIRAALAAAGFTVEVCAPWRPLTDDIPGKTWWVARRG
jgi:SAM-dependent methyltransferase